MPVPQSSRKNWWKSCQLAVVRWSGLRIPQVSAYLATPHTKGTPVNVCGEEFGSSRHTLGAGLVNDWVVKVPSKHVIIESTLPVTTKASNDCMQIIFSRKTYFVKYGWKSLWSRRIHKIRSLTLFWYSKCIRMKSRYNSNTVIYFSQKEKQKSKKNPTILKIFWNVPINQ